MTPNSPTASLPGSAYTDPEIFRRELVAIFGNTWQYVCHIENLRNPGDYVVVDVATENTFLICDDQGRVRGFFNVCAHRASRLLEGQLEDQLEGHLEGKGCAKRITCPYHGWTYDTHGKLIAAPNSDQVPGFDKSDYGLAEFQVEVINGLIFANLNPDAKPFEEYCPGLQREFKKYSPDLPELTFVHRTEAHLKGNWKVAVENFSECYHCALLHPDLVNRILEFDSYKVKVNQHWHKHESRAKQNNDGIYRYKNDGGAGSAEFAGLWLWPNFAFQNYPGGAVHVWKWAPVDESNTHVTVDWFFKSSELEKWENDLISHHAANTFAEDIPIIGRVQQGLASGRYKPGPLMVDQELSQLSEHGVADIQRYWRTAMES